MLKFFRRRRQIQETGARNPESGAVDVATDAAQRAEAFWKRWDELLPEVNAALGDGASHRVDHMLAEACAAVHPNLTLSIERGVEGLYALVVSSQADPELRPYTDAWKAAAPEQDSVWEFHDSIPPVPDPTQVTVNLHGQPYSLADVRVAPRVDEGEGLVDVAVHHPGFGALEEAEREALTFLPLEATLGERLAADRVGRVETADVEPQGAIGLLEFRDIVRSLDGPTSPPES
jgi:hypothetical protein